MESFSELLKNIMADKKIGQNSLSKLLKISRNHVSTLLSGKRNATPTMIDRISEKLKLNQELTSALHTAGARDRGYKI